MACVAHLHLPDDNLQRRREKNKHERRRRAVDKCGDKGYVSKQERSSKVPSPSSAATRRLNDSRGAAQRKRTRPIKLLLLLFLSLALSFFLKSPTFWTLTYFWKRRTHLSECWKLWLNASRLSSLFGAESRAAAAPHTPATLLHFLVARAQGRRERGKSMVRGG